MATPLIASLILLPTIIRSIMGAPSTRSDTATARQGVDPIDYSLSIGFGTIGVTALILQIMNGQQINRIQQRVADIQMLLMESADDDKLKKEPNLEAFLPWHQTSGPSWAQTHSGIDWDTLEDDRRLREISPGIHHQVSHSAGHVIGLPAVAPYQLPAYQHRHYGSVAPILDPYQYKF